MNKNKELIKNTVILFVGRISTQFITFILLPIYTQYFLTSDYGYVDLIQTYITLLAPIVILRFDSAIFRFLIDSRSQKEDQNVVITSSFFLILVQMVILIVIYRLLSIFIKFNYKNIILLNIIFVSLSSYLLQMIRGIGKNIDYSIASIISAFTTIIINLVLILKFKLNASSIIIASTFANVACCIYLCIKSNFFSCVSYKKFSFSKLKEMLKYSLPMIPDGLSWWVVNVSDRTIISILINTSANGIYAVSSKFSNILSSIFQIFNMSWQESASMHINDYDRDKFFSNVLNRTYDVFYSLCVGIMICMPFVMKYLIGSEYESAYYYIPILLLGNLFNAIAYNPKNFIKIRFIIIFIKAAIIVVPATFFVSFFAI